MPIHLHEYSPGVGEQIKGGRFVALRRRLLQILDGEINLRLEIREEHWVDGGTILGDPLEKQEPIRLYGIGLQLLEDRRLRRLGIVDHLKRRRQQRGRCH